MALDSNIMGVKIDNLNIYEASALIFLYLEKNKKKIVFTPNPEFVMEAKKNPEFLKILNSSDLNIPDGIGLIIASKILGKPLRERVAGIDLIESIFSKIKNTDKKVYFLGAKKETVELAKKMVEKKYRGINIVGVRDGYFSKYIENDVIKEINDLKPDLLLVGLGSPKQETWIFENKDKLDFKVAIGVGGSFDVLSGKVKRAPQLFIKMHLEWFYRFLKQPSRLFRMLKLPIFMINIFLLRLKQDLLKFIKKTNKPRNL